MRLVLARLNHETNTFSPVPTPLSAFRPLWGAQALAAAEGSPTALGAFHAFAKRLGAEIRVPLIAHADPSGPAEDEVFDALVESIVAAVREGCDAILLDLHGAMVTKGHDDAEAEVLARVRRAALGVPLGVALDLHGNITQRLVDQCDVLVGFKTYPHVDMVETGAHVARLMAPLLRGEAPLYRALCHPPVLAATLRMNTTVPGAMADLVDMARAAETEPGVQAVSLFGGFPLADVASAGLSVVALADTEDRARQVATRIGQAAWDRRADFVYHQEPLSDCIDRARKLAGGDKPVLLLDHSDNCNSGGPCDNMDVLEALLETGERDIMVGPIADREAVAALFAAGEGALVSIQLGNKTPAPGLPAPRPPLSLTGRVRALSAGSYRVSGPIYHGQVLSMGRAAAFETDQAVIVVCEQPHEPLDLGVFTCVGLDPLPARFVLLKSRMYCRPVFEPLCAQVVECAGQAVTSSDYDLFTFRALQRPIYPLDPAFDWNA